MSIVEEVDENNDTVKRENQKEISNPEELKSYIQKLKEKVGKH